MAIQMPEGIDLMADPIPKWLMEQLHVGVYDFNAAWEKWAIEDAMYDRMMKRLAGE